MSAPSVVCEGLTKRYGDSFRLGPVDLDLGPGVTCLVGANGAGKSTLFRLLAGVDTPSSGCIRRTGPQALGYLPQAPAFPKNATCRDFLCYVAWLQRMPRQRRASAVDHALRMVGLGDRTDARIKTLSGGMARRLGIAQALVHEPPLVLLDEPTVGLDPVQRLELRTLVASVGQDRSVLVSTHLVEDVRGMADRVLLLTDGRVTFDGSVAALEAHARDDAPGDTPLERALSGLMAAAA